jgi:hypothetical protein
MAITPPVVALPESVFDIGDRLEELLKQARQEAYDGTLSASVRARLADTVEVLRSRLVSKTERDPRSLFDLDERLVELLDSADEAAEVGEIPPKLLQEINDYLEAFQTKVDRIAGYWRWQESVAGICGDEAERLSARKRSAERRVNRLQEMLIAFMMSRGLRKLEGDKSTVGLQSNSMPSLEIE